MQSLLNAIKAFKAWQWGVVVVVLGGIVGGTYIGYAMASNPSVSGLQENQQLIPVQIGTLTNQVSTNGSVAFPNRETLAFATQGTLGEVLVTDGQQVSKGQTVAKLDADTVANLEKSVAQARLNLQNAQKALDDLKAPASAQSMAQAEATVTGAKLTLRNTSENLKALMDGPDSDTLLNAQAPVNNNALALQNAERDLKLARKDWDDKLEAAQDTLDNARDGYLAEMRKWLGVELTSQEVSLPPDALLAALGIDLNVLFNPASRYSDFSLGIGANGLPTDDPVTRWNEVTVYAWMNFHPALILPFCNSGVPPQGLCIKNGMDTAWLAFSASLNALDTIQTQADKALASAQNSLVRAQDTLASSQQAFAELNVATDSLEIEDGQKQVALATATLGEVQKALQELLSGPDELELAVKQADVSLAQLALNATRQRLEGASLKATMDGTVSSVDVRVGDAVTPSTTVLSIVDMSVAEVSGIVDEIDVLFVQEGSQAIVTMDALPGQALLGVVSSIDAAAQSQQGVVSYPIHIELTVPEGVALREGLSATARIVIGQESNVALVPLQALTGTFAQPKVQVYKEGLIEDRDVTIGTSDDFWVAVRSGLSEGEQVVVTGSQASVGTIGFGGRGLQLPGGSGRGQFVVPTQGGGSQGDGRPQGGQGQGGNQPRPTPRTP